MIVKAGSMFERERFAVHFQNASSIDPNSDTQALIKSLYTEILDSFLCSSRGCGHPGQNRSQAKKFEVSRPRVLPP